MFIQNMELRMNASNAADAGTKTIAERKAARAAKPGLDRAVSPRAALPGTQVIRRIGDILRFIAARNRVGARLTDIATALSLEPPTAHRLLQGLAGGRMVRFDAATKLYRLGPELYELGMTAAEHFDLLEVLGPSVQRLVDATGDSVVVTVRSGVDGVCVDHRAGVFPIRTSVVSVGSRRPLSSGAGGLAILATLEQAQAERIVAENVAGDKALLELRLRRLAEARRSAYAVNEYRRPAPGIVALGVPICGVYGECLAGLAIVALGNRLSGKRRAEVVGLLKTERERVVARLRAFAI
jgi:DNA-binding IclR family transcriptional regulator